MDFDSPERLRQQKRLPARLVFDTAGRPARAGTRRREVTSRHLLYEIEKLCLDLRLDQPPQSTEAVIVGQLADREDPLKPLAGMPVFLVSGERFLARTVSNRQGEFRVRYKTGESSSLCLSLGNDQLIEVPVEPQAGAGVSPAPKT